jgi:hypothetical protein
MTSDGWHIGMDKYCPSFARFSVVPFWLPMFILGRILNFPFLNSNCAKVADCFPKLPLVEMGFHVVYDSSFNNQFFIFGC